MHLALELKQITQYKSVLYVEDNDMVRKGLVRSLEQLFNKCVVAQNGQEALDQFDKNNIDLIITDLTMPIMDGLEFIDSLEQQNEKIPPIIVLTVHTDEKFVPRLKELGINNILAKPVDGLDLIKMLYNVCV